MISISLESIEKKLGFDPLNPPRKVLKPDEVDDSPSLWEKLSADELAYLIEITSGIKMPKERG